MMANIGKNMALMDAVDSNIGTSSSFILELAINADKIIYN